MSKLVTAIGSIFALIIKIFPLPFKPQIIRGEEEAIEITTNEIGREWMSTKR